MKLEDLYTVTTPLFTPEMGKRFALARMKCLRRQEDAARILGVSQPVVASIETGRVNRAKFTVAQMRGVFVANESPDFFLSYVLLGANQSKFDERAIRWQFEKHYNSNKSRWAKRSGNERYVN